MNLFESFGELTRLGPEFALKFIVAMLCGGALGMERETTGKPAGLRTSILVCMGSMLFTEMSILMAGRVGGDGTRIAAQIVTGIGFLGAGVIMHGKRGGIAGITTSAMIWLMAALGMMIGAGYPISALLLSAASVIMILGLRRLERHIHNRLARDYKFVMADSDESRERVMSLLTFYEDGIENIAVDAAAQGQVAISFRYVGPNSELHALLQGIYQVKGLRRIQEGGGKDEGRRQKGKV
jgi:putative Mg2+ transporter-C (MgtC) family protein